MNNPKKEGWYWCRKNNKSHFMLVQVQKDSKGSLYIVGVDHPYSGMQNYEWGECIPEHKVHEEIENELLGSLKETFTEKELLYFEELGSKNKHPILVAHENMIHNINTCCPKTEFNKIHFIEKVFIDFCVNYAKKEGN